MNTRSPFIAATALATALLLAGCAVGPNYHKPLFDYPAEWLGLRKADTDTALAAAGKPAAEMDMQWWHAYGDPLLDKLMAQALERNGDLKVAIARVEEARGERLSATAALLPEIDGAAQANRGNNNVSNHSATTSSAALDASWELDLFGGNRRAAEAARAALGGAEAGARLARVRLLAEVADSYLDVRSLQQQLQLTARNLRDDTEILRITQAQYDVGVAGELDLARARAQAADTAAQVPQVRAQLSAAVNSLGVLVGDTPAEIQAVMADARDVPVATPQVLLDTPASVIARRPDVAVAERALAEATANKGVALSNWFPRINLTGLFGIADFGTGGNDVWNVGGTIGLPVLDFGRVRGLVRVADAQQKEALATYEQTILSALADVETSLDGYLQATDRLKKLQVAADANERAVTLAQAQYKEGVVAQLDVLTAEKAAAAARIALAAGKAQQGQALATLYKAIGG